MGQPAARLGDMHTCPMVTPGTPPIPHVGGPIVSPGEPTVFIGMLPAAVVGDMCTCVGPPDSIVMGSTTVFIGGRMAARMGDSTVHGGVITIGCPTVLIGDVGSGGAGGIALGALCPAIGALEGLSLNERREQEKAIASNISDPSLTKLRHDRDMAMVAAAAYKTEDGSTPLLPSGYAPANAADLEQLGVKSSQLEPDMQVFKNNSGDGPDYVVAYRGTETHDGLWTEAKDIGVDIMQGSGFETDAYTNSIVTGRKIADAAQKNHLNVELTGHSKGGGQAAAVSAATGLRATTQNAAGVHAETLSRAGVSPEELKAAETNITAYNNERDPLNGAQDNRTEVLSPLGPLASFIMGPAGTLVVNAFMGGALRGGDLPQALGTRIVVPAAKTQGTGMGEGHDKYVLIDAMNEQIDEKLKAACGC